MTAVTRDPDTPYTFSNDAPTGSEMLSALGATLDEFTTARLIQAGVAPGARCLEVGAGAGTIAVWMADQVGPTGTVIATDIKPQFIPEHPGLTTLKHNLLTDPLPEGPFDVIHARAVLQHLPERHEILARLKGALAPGGALVIEELEAGWSRSVLASPDPRADEIFTAYEKALTTILVANGNDQTWCRKVNNAMRDQGFEDVETQGWQGSFAGGTGVCLMAYAGSTELREKLIEVGMDAADVDTMRQLALDPRLVLRGILMLSTIGRKAR